mmetsp:Transcript_16061/g.46004  ORF Transcript_16061/g.46004 Transcript_16061/m.46004 type:complete len:364 (+) Transcript_16061:1175-2266(+)
MGYSQCPGGILLPHQAGDVVLRAPLGDGHHVDVCLGQRGEEHGRHAALVGHAVPDSRKDAAVVHGLDVLDAPRPNGLGKPPPQGGDGLARVRLLHCKRHTVLRRRLGDHDGVDIRVPHGPKDGGSRARHTDHSRPLYVDERHVRDRRQSLHAKLAAQRVCVVIPADDRARRGPVEEVPAAHRDVELHGRDGRLRVQHLRTKIRQLPRLVICELLEAHGVFDHPRVGRVDAVHVRPDGDSPAPEQSAHDGGRVIRAIPLECCDHTFRRPGDEAGADDDVRGPVLVAPRIQLGVGRVVMNVHRLAIRCRRHNDHLPSVHEPSVHPQLAAARRGQPRAPELPVPHDVVLVGVHAHARDAERLQHGP